MDDLFRFGFTNAAWATALAVAVAVGAWFMRRRPAVVHVLWLLVLIKLVTPSLTQVGFPGHRTIEQDASRRPAAVSLVTPDPGPDQVAGGREANRPMSRPPAPQRLGPEVVRSPRVEAGAARPWPWRLAVLLVWGTGAAVWWAIVGLSSHRFRCLARSARPAPNELADRASQIAACLGLHQAPTIGLVPVRVPPMLWASFVGTPRLLLPEELWARLDALQQDAVLAHELAHLKRRDHWVRRLEAIVLGLYWWYPGAWWARRQLERAEEECCDVWVIWALPSAAGRYAEALVATVAFLSGLRQPLPWGASGVGRTLPIKRRLNMILRDETAGPIVRTAPRVVLLLGALALPFLPALASDEQAGATSPIAPAQAKPPREATKTTTPHANTERKLVQGGVVFKEVALDPKKPAERVRICQPIMRAVRDYVDVVGSLQAAHTVQLRARVGGMIDNVQCRVGQTVKVGDPLFQIDARSYQMEAKKARAEVQRAEARAKRFKHQMDNTENLNKRHVASNQAVELAEDEFEEAAASVRAAMADLDLAMLRAEATQVRSPIAGTVSGPILDAGSVVAADTTVLATVVALDPMYVVFGLAEAPALRLISEAKSQTDGSPAPIVKVGLAGEQDFSRTAVVSPGDVVRVSGNGQIPFRAALSNHDGILLPGLSALVRLFRGPPHKALLVPQSSIKLSGDAPHIFFVNEKNAVGHRKVQVGLDHDGLTEVRVGLSADDWIIVDPSSLQPPTR